jgi:DNA-binding XRE family transcriptional regulator
MTRSKRRCRPHSGTPAAHAAAPLRAVPEAAVSLGGLRRTLAVTQVDLAGTLGASQRAVSHVEHEPNPRVATLAGYIGALGGRLQLRAIFDDRVVELELTRPPATRTTRGRDDKQPERVRHAD